MSTQNPGSRKRTFLVVGILATALTLGVAGTVVAKQRGYNCDEGERHGGLGAKAIEELGLSTEQAAKLESLRERAMSMRTEQRDAMSDVRGVFRSERNADNPDLRAVVEQVRQVMDARHAQQRSMIDEGLALYETLSAEQQRKVMGMLENRFGRHGHGRMHGGRGEHRGGYGRDYDAEDEDDDESSS